MAKQLKKSKKDIPKLSKELCDKMLRDLERAKRPTLKAVKCALDNANYNSKLGYFTPGDKKITTELNVSSVQKLARTVFLLEMMLANMKTGTVRTKRELYYLSKGMVKSNAFYKPLDFDSQDESDGVLSYICDLLEVYREEMNCFANDRGGQTYSKNLVVTEHLEDGTKAVIDLAQLGTTPFQPKNKPQSFTLKSHGAKLKFCLIVESEGTANSLVANGFTKRNNCIVVGAGGVPSNGVRGWAKTIQDQLKIPIFFFGDLDAYTLQNIFRTLKAGSAASLIRNSDFSAPDVKFLGVLPEDVKKYDLDCYSVSEKDSSDARALKKAKDALERDPFFKDKKNKKLADVLRWLIKEKVRCEQQSVFAIDPTDPEVADKFILDKIRKGSFI